MIEGMALRGAAAFKVTRPSDPAYPVVLRNFLQAMLPAFRRDGIDVLYRLRAIDLDQVAGELRTEVVAQNCLADALANASADDRDDLAWLFAFGLCNELGFALALASRRPRGNLLQLATWMGRCVVAEALVGKPGDTCLDREWSAQTEIVEGALRECLAACGSGGAIAQTASDAAAFVNRRPKLRYLLQLGQRERRLPDDERWPASVADLAAIVCTPLTRLPGLQSLLEDRGLHSLALEKFAAQDYFFETQDDVEADLAARCSLASVVAAELEASAARFELDKVIKALGLAAPRGYSARQDYCELQRLRAQGYDKVVRLQHADVDVVLEPAEAGTVGLLMSTLTPSAESTAALMYARAFQSAGFRTKVVLWPHNGWQGESDAQFEAEFEVVDLRFVRFEDRVAVVRALRLQALFLMNNATWGWSEYIAACCMRLAAVQVATYLSPVTIGFRNIDYFLIGTDSEGPGAKGRYLEALLQMEGSVLCFPRANAVPPQPRPPNARRVGACGASLPKLTPDSLATIFAVASEARLAELVFYPFNPSWGVPASDLLHSYLERQARSAGYNGILTIVGPFAQQDAISELLERCDLYIDSYPHSGGLSVLDAVERGLPVAYRAGSSQRSLQARNVVEATSAQALDVEHRSPRDVETLVAAGRRAPPEQTQHALFDPKCFGRLVADALGRIGVVPAPPAQRFKFRHIVTASTLRTNRRSLAYVDTRLSQPCSSSIVGAGTLMLASMPVFEAQFANTNHVFRSSVGRFLFDSVCDQRVYFSISCYNATAGEQLQAVTAEESSGWANRLLQGSNDGVLIACDCREGTNVVDIVSSLDQSGLKLKRAHRIAAFGSFDRREFKARWRARRGFSSWEGATPTHGLDAPFQWCVGPSSTIEVLVDRPGGVAGIALEIKVAAPAYEMIVTCASLSRSLMFRREAGSFDDIEVLEIDGPFAEGSYEITFEPKVAAVSTDRDITFILRNVALTC